ncbi:MAG: SHOCT domain-containing protein [Eubacterium sp.]|nr:SHOCT domain-containing protein [Eubacterium sp.]
MEECFYLKPTIGTNDWFEEMAIPYAKIKSLEIVERKISNTEWLLSSSDSDMKAMEQKNNIEIEYEDVDGNEQFIRLEMLTGISIYGQAKKCVEFMDVLRQNGILKKFAGNHNAAQNMQGQQMSGVQAGETQAANGDVILEQIEKLAGLKEKGILSEEEYQQKKSELLAKL